MKYGKVILVSIFVFLFNFSSFGQKIDDNDLKNVAIMQNDKQTIKKNNKYSPVLAGTYNFLFPASGYFYVREPIRGAVVLISELVAGGAVVCGIVMAMTVNSNTGKSMTGGRWLMISGNLAFFAIHIWSIFDVVKIAKKKNLAYHFTKVSISLKPNLFVATSHNENNFAYGLHLSLKF